MSYVAGRGVGSKGLDEAAAAHNRNISDYKRWCLRRYEATSVHPTKPLRGPLGTGEALLEDHFRIQEAIGSLTVDRTFHGGSIEASSYPADQGHVNLAPLFLRSVRLIAKRNGSHPEPLEVTLVDSERQYAEVLDPILSAYRAGCDYLGVSELKKLPGIGVLVAGCLSRLVPIDPGVVEQHTIIAERMLGHDVGASSAIVDWFDGLEIDPTVSSNGGLLRMVSRLGAMVNAFSLDKDPHG